MITTLKNSVLRVQVKAHGAEICSVTDSNGTEFIWQAKKEIWARHTPVLFPIVGKLEGDKFIFEGEEYSLPQHGFARDIDFELLHADSDSCHFQLQATDETYAKYPFDFELHVIHRLSGNTIETKYQVKNNSEGALFFSIGAHPGFNCPLSADEKFEDYFLEFEKDTLQRTLLENGLLTDQRSTLELKDGKLFLDPGLFDHDALVFEGAQVQKITLASSRTSHRISMKCPNFPYFGIWTKKGNRNFVCLEPWFGIADDIHHDQKLNRKKGIQVLPSAGSFEASFQMSFE